MDNPRRRRPKALSLLVNAQGRYFVGDRGALRTDVESLKATLREVAGDDRDRPVLLRADARTPHQAVVTALDALGQLGFRRVAIATAPEPAPTGPRRSEDATQAAYRRLRRYARPATAAWSRSGSAAMALEAAASAGTLCCWARSSTTSSSAMPSGYWLPGGRVPAAAGARTCSGWWRTTPSRVPGAGSPATCGCN